MSTPSTVTATLPNHHHHFPHYQNYQPTYHVNDQYSSSTPRYGNPAYSSYGSSTSELRRAATSTSRPSQSLQLPPIQTPQYSSEQYSPDMASQQRSRDRKKGPDWADFYKHGVPKEVIVIDDTPEPDQEPSNRSNQPSSRQNNASSSSRPAEKRRKTGANSAYDTGLYNQHQSSHASHNDNSSSNNTASTDRTTSAVHTTAPTSLGSQASNGTHLPQLEDGVVGQKRKRTTRQAAQVEAKESKRRVIEIHDDPYSEYVPPPFPPRKAKDVYVQVITDKSYTKDQNVDDDDGHYIVVPDADLTDRYQIIKLLGQGTFGKVVEAYDRRKANRVAIKVIRSVQKYRDASRIELRVLSTLAQNDRDNRNKCIHLRDCFDFRKHICIVTDLYGQSVFDFLKSNQFVPFPSSHIQTFARQLFTSVAFLHDLNLIHTDLKPENILLVKNAYQTFTYNRNIPSSSTATSRTARHRKVLLDPEIRLIDFGSATFDDEYHSSVVSTRHYRAPEIILNLGWSFPCDIWSIGCILVEFYTGDALFQTHDNLEHLAMMEAVCGGKLDADIVKQVTKSERGSSRNSAAAYFKGRKLDYPNANTPKASRKYVKAMKKLQDTIPPHTEFNKNFLDLLRRIFVYSPKSRITAKEALKHPWFQSSLQDDGTEAARIKIQKEEKERKEAAAAAARRSYQ